MAGGSVTLSRGEPRSWLAEPNLGRTRASHPLNRWPKAWLIALTASVLAACQPSTVPTPIPSGSDTSGTNSASTGPSPRSDAAAAMDPRSGGFLIFGGHRGQDLLADTWVRDGHAWVEVRTATHPPARFSAAAAEDPTNKSIVLFGGYGDSILGDTWVWSSGSWRIAHPAHSPTARFGHAMAYDASADRVVLFGGQDGPNSILNDTWFWDGADWSRATLPAGPGPRAFVALAFDADRRELLLTGVYPGSDVSTWVFDGSAWRREVSSSSYLPWAIGATAAYDPLARKTLMVTSGPRPQDLPLMLLEWDGSSWVRRASSLTPPARVGAAFGYDRLLGRMLLFGGRSVTVGQNGLVDGAELADTWAWNGRNWQEL
jgi:Galactose oxidase, central domain/Kelch motif